MIHNDLRKKAFEANLSIVEHDLVTLTWGNASVFDSFNKIIAIKPSGVPYSDLKWQDIVLLDLDLNNIDSKLRPSSDKKTHVEIYKNFDNVKGIVHTHSRWATTWAQAQLPIPCVGTTHADHFYGEVPCIPILNEDQILDDYEKNTGLSIVEYYFKNKLNPIETPGCILSGHAPFTWGKTIKEAIENAVALEYVAMMAFNSLKINNNIDFPNYILNKHYKRKHGKESYYGQKK